MVSVRTNAKVNLFLKVVGMRPDGYHSIESVFHSVGLADDLTVVQTDTGAIAVTMGSAPGRGPIEPIAPQDNLAYRAAGTLFDRRPTGSGLAINITKLIPIGAGLAGGSGNAAGVLLTLDRLWDLGLSASELGEVAATIGSDVPYCIEGGSALVTGRGETVTPLPAARDLWLVLGLSNTPLLTAGVYRAWDDSGTTSEDSAAAMAAALAAGDVQAIASRLHNDLEPVAFSLRPELATAKAAMLEAGAAGALMSGSGPTIFGVVEDEAAARSVGAKVAEAFDTVEIASTRSACVEVSQG